MLPSAGERGLGSVKVSESPRHLGLQEHIVLCPSPVHLLLKVCHSLPVLLARLRPAVLGLEGLFPMFSDVYWCQYKQAGFLKPNKEQQMQLCK